MSLTELWRNAPIQFEDKHLQQIIAFTGDGKLRDHTPTATEFREFLAQIPSELLARYIMECLNDNFPDSGLALQDLVNQLGHRLGFRVENGLYRGRRNAIGLDGLWRFPNGHGVVVEIKTTDTYRIDTDVVAGYRKQLINAGRLEEERSSILFVVGRQDTGDLEAQIRGSKHAWDVRLIGVQALLNLLRLKESVDDPQLVDRICSILIPREFTRLDEIVEIVFFATEEAKQEAPALEEADDPESGITHPDSTAPATPATPPSAFHGACIERFQQRRGLKLIKRSRSGFSTEDGATAVVCAVSKAHQRQNRTSYWFAFHPYQKTFLAGAEQGYLLLGCGSAEQVLVIPYAELEGWLESLWTTENNTRFYWHLRVHHGEEGLCLDRRGGFERLNLEPYRP